MDVMTRWRGGVQTTALSMVFAALLCGCRQESVPSVAVAAPTGAPAVEAAPMLEPARLVGRWQRPDGGYVLEIRAAAADGKLDAGYFNPNPIHVSQATWARGADQGLAVFVELRDANYPGATYKLTYRPTDDALTGQYHQPAVGQTFEVEFARLR